MHPRLVKELASELSLPANNFLIIMENWGDRDKDNRVNQNLATILKKFSDKKLFSKRFISCLEIAVCGSLDVQNRIKTEKHIKTFRHKQLYSTVTISQFHVYKASSQTWQAAKKCQSGFQCPTHKTWNVDTQSVCIMCSVHTLNPGPGLIPCSLGVVASLMGVSQRELELWVVP